MTLSDILKGSLKVVGSAGLILVDGLCTVLSSGTQVNNENKAGLDACDSLSAACRKQLDKMWFGEDEDEDEIEKDDFTRQVENYKKKLERIEKLICQNEKSLREAEREGDDEHAEELRETISALQEEYRSVEEDYSDFRDNHYAPPKEE